VELVEPLIYVGFGKVTCEPLYTLQVGDTILINLGESSMALVIVKIAAVLLRIGCHTLETSITDQLYAWSTLGPFAARRQSVIGHVNVTA